ncbi:MAG TPA: ABC transporter substrate-binding protein [Acetobacteraceae bacterium]
MHRRVLLAGAASALLATPAIAQSAHRTLRFVPQANLTILDPVWTTAGVTNGHGYYVFDTLYGIDSKLQPRPQMAEGHSVENDGRSWLIRLRPGLFFHDNTPVRAADCVASLTRWSARDPFGQLVARAVDAWEAADDRTIRVRLNKPFPRLLDALAKPVTPPFIMPERIARSDPNTAVTEMVGSGPYRFLAGEYVSGHRVAYARFDRYAPREEPADWLSGGKRAGFERVEWHIIPDPATVAAALRNDEVDWWEWGLPDLLPMLARDPKLRVKVADGIGLYSILRFNMLVPPFDNPRLRRALLEAVDQDDFMRPITANDPAGYRACYAMIPCGIPHSREVGAALMKPPRDVARSRAAIQAAGYKGERVVILNPTDLPSLSPLGQVAADLMKKLGMNVDLQEMDWGTLVQRRGSMEPVERGGWNMFPTNGSPLVVGPPVMNIYIRGQGAKAWVGWYDNPEIERLTESWLDASSDAEQQRIYDAIQVSAFANPPIVPLGQYFPQTVHRQELSGLQDFIIPTPWTVRRS